MNDGLLDMSLIRGAGTLRTLFNVPKAYKGTHLSVKSLTEYRKLSSLRLKANEDRDLPFHMDGEKGFSRDLDFKVVQDMMWTVHPLG
jgi:diacylglycerol kinase family enzyme